MKQEYFPGLGPFTEMRKTVGGAGWTHKFETPISCPSRDKDQATEQTSSGFTGKVQAGNTGHWPRFSTATIISPALMTLISAFPVLVSLFFLACCTDQDHQYNVDRNSNSRYSYLVPDLKGKAIQVVSQSIAFVSAWNVGDPGSIPGLGRSPGERNGNPLQYSCLENPMEGGAWWATVHGVAKSRTRLSDFTPSHTVHC